jgi:hypothetical protein
VIVEEESVQKADGPDVQHHHEEPAKEEMPGKLLNDGSRGGQKRIGWPVRLLVILIVLLFATSIVNLVVSQRAYESAQKQITAIEELTQSIKAVQRSIVELYRMMEQSPPEDEQPEGERDAWPAEDGSI